MMLDVDESTKKRRQMLKSGA